MRTVKFRDVLWQTARMAGFSPESGNFMANQALPMAESISRWVDRLYPDQDWPEWTKTVIAVPDTNHIVGYDIQLAAGTAIIQIRVGRTVHVYLVDPRTTDTPIITEHRLTDEGIHCGYDHGTNVWIRYIEPPPKFTAEQWNPANTYQIEDTIYSYTTGECYRSKVNNNQGNDPSVAGPKPVPVPIPSQITQQYQPPTLGTPGQDKILYVDIGHYQGPSSNGPPALPDPPPNSATFYIPVLDNNNTLLGSATHVATGAQSIATIGADLVSQLIAALGVGWTITYDTPTKTVRIRNASDFILNNTNGGPNFPYYQAGALPGVKPFVLTEIQPYIKAVPAGAVTPQITVVSFSQQQIVPGATYTFTFFDQTEGFHAVSYKSDPSDDIAAILGGIANAITTAALTDPFFQNIGVSVDLTTNTITLRSNRVIAVDPTFTIASSAFWELLAFPQALAAAVIRGASADFLQEWGQTQAGLLTEQGVPSEESNSRGDFETTPTANLTNQTAPDSRYKTKKANLLW